MELLERINNSSDVSSSDKNLVNDKTLFENDSLIVHYTFNVVTYTPANAINPLMICET